MNFRLIGSSLIGALLLTTGGSAYALTTTSDAPRVATSSRPTSIINTQGYEDLLDRLDSAEAAQTPDEAAAMLFPDDINAQAEVGRLLAEAESSIRSVDGHTQYAVPAALVPFLIVLAKCAVGALGSAGVNEVVTLVHKGEQASAESRVYAVVGGCITSSVPAALRPLAQKAARPIATAMLAILVRWFS